MVVQQAFIHVYLRPDTTDTIISHPPNSSCRVVTERDGVYQAVKKQVEEFMTTAGPTPMHWIYDTRTYGLKIQLTTGGVGTVDWFGDELRYRHVRFRLDAFRSWVHGVVYECRRILMSELLLLPESQEPVTTAPVIPWDELYDDPTQAQA